MPIAEPEDNGDDDATEQSPLKPKVDDDENKTKTNGSIAKSLDKLDTEKDEDGDSDDELGLAYMLSQPKVRFLVVTGCVIAFAVIAIIATIIAVTMSEPDQWPDDLTPRMLKVIPAPNGPQNLIRFRAGHGDEGSSWPELTKQITVLYENYSVDANIGKKNFTSCDAGPPSSEDLVCFISSESVKLNCNGKNNYGYPDASPCLILQYNHKNLFNFTPEVYSKEDLNNIEGLPQVLK